MNGGFPPIKKENIKKLPKKNINKFDSDKSDKIKRFSSNDINNVNLKDILSFVKIKKTEDKIINNEILETVTSL